MALTKEKLADTIRDACGSTKKDSHRLVEKVLEIMKDTLVNGENLMLGQRRK